MGFRVGARLVCDVWSGVGMSCGREGGMDGWAGLWVSSRLGGKRFM